MIDDHRAAVLAEAYLSAKISVLHSPYAAELVTIRPSPDAITESEFLRELAWVILSGGMAERIIRLKFTPISESFLYWTSAAEISERVEICVASALEHFAHNGKINAIAAAAKLITNTSFEAVKEKVIANPVLELQKFPYIGPVTALHMAKNIGISIAKPDRHLTRLSKAAGFDQVLDFCNCIASFVGDDVPKIDMVLWRFATLHRDYLCRFTTQLEALD